LDLKMVQSSVFTDISIKANPTWERRWDVCNYAWTCHQWVRKRCTWLHPLKWNANKKDKQKRTPMFIPHLVASFFSFLWLDTNCFVS
jgi:hypothetical protein